MLFPVSELTPITHWSASTVARSAISSTSPSRNGTRHGGGAPMSNRCQFRDGEKHLSQIPALHLLQTMAPKWVMLSKEEVDRERRGKLSNVLLEDILRNQLMRLN